MQANVNLLLHVDNAHYSLPTIFRVLGDLLLTSKSTNTTYFIIHQKYIIKSKMKFLLSNRSNK